MARRFRAVLGVWLRSGQEGQRGDHDGGARDGPEPSQRPRGGRGVALVVIMSSSFYTLITVIEYVDIYMLYI